MELTTGQYLQQTPRILTAAHAVQLLAQHPETKDPRRLGKATANEGSSAQFQQTCFTTVSRKRSPSPFCSHNCLDRPGDLVARAYWWAFCAVYIVLR